MEYTIKSLSQIAGISTRTLRYYDEIGLLKPARVNSSGYRIYGKKEVELLQQILIYRELEVSLEDIKQIISSPSFDIKGALEEHRANLLAKRNRIDMIIQNVDKTLEETKGRVRMSDKDRFEGLKQKMVEENEQKYGEELRQKYGEDTIDQSNKKLLKMTEAEFTEAERLGEEVLERLKEAMKTGNPQSAAAQRTAELHKRWLTFYWNSYSKEAHANLARMYVDDERFTAYYDKVEQGAAVFLRDAILHYTSL
ncbi:MerR family transcriptional regulator [Niallia sp. FSL R7-0271]|uniref:MerR family transcriptional regulator n=1 Tax=Niallia sp. FSL R7-0271 TaxID=2921678 RepID=UPI0030F72D01